MPIEALESLLSVGIDFRDVEVESYRSREEWLARRPRTPSGVVRLGGSQAAAALGKSKWLGPYGLYLELVEGIRPERYIKNVRAAEILEGCIGQIYAEQEGVGMVRFPQWTIIASKQRRAFFSPDFLIAPTADRGPGVFDAKTWEGGALPKTLPDDYLMQVDHAMSVWKGFTYGVIGILRGRTVHAYVVERDEARIRALEHGEDMFLQLCDARSPPAMDVTEGSMDAVDELVAAHTAKGIEADAKLLSEEHAELVRLLRANRKMKTESTKTVKQLTQKLKLASMGGAFRVPGSEATMDWLHVDVAGRWQKAYGYDKLVLGAEDEDDDA